MYWHRRRDFRGRAASPAFFVLSLACGLAARDSRTMINDPGKRLAAGFWKVLAGLALVLLLLTQQAREPEPEATDEIAPQVETGGEEQP